MTELQAKPNKVKSILLQIVLIMLVLIINIPILYALYISFTEGSQIISLDKNFSFANFTLSNYEKAITQVTLGRFMLNTLWVSLISASARVITASLAAFGFTFFDFSGKNLLFLFVVGTIMIPGEVVMITNYQTVANFGLIDTYLGIVIVALVSSSNIFLIRQNFLSFSKSLREAAYIDGCSNFRFFTQILMPTSMPVLVTVFIQAFISQWNSYLWPLMVTNRNEMRTVQTAITMLNFPDGSNHGAIMATSILVLIPSIFVFVIFQRKIISGMMSGAVKG